MTLYLLLLLFQSSSIPHYLYPYPELMGKAETYLTRCRSLFSDYPDLARLAWSVSVAGPCPDEVTLTGDESLPCSERPFLPPTGRPLPLSLYTIYQQLVYTPPSSPSTQKASLSQSYVLSLFGSGVMWHMTVTAKGIQHDIWFCEYRRIERTIQIAPLIYIDVFFLEPETYHHVMVKPTGQYNIQTHDIKNWMLPLSDATKRLMYDTFHPVQKCGTTAYVYTTAPGETLTELFQGLMPGAAEIMAGDRQAVVTPDLGRQPCGEFSYAGFCLFMTHRSVETPSFFPDGPPLEVWTFQNPRDASASTAEVLDPESEPSSPRSAALKAALQDDGLSGAIVVDPEMVGAIDAQEAIEDQRYKHGPDRVEMATSLIEMMLGSPNNQSLWELFRLEVGPYLEVLDVVNDTEIEFNPFGPHCRDGEAYLPAYPGHIPIVGQHFFPELEECGFCVYHDKIIAEPRSGWSHRRLLDMGWNWGRLHGQWGDLRQKAHAFVQKLIFFDHGVPPRPTLNDLQTNRAQRQMMETNSGGSGDSPMLNDLEAEPSETTLNTTHSRSVENLPDIFVEDFDPCNDPSWTIEYLFLYGEIDDIIDAPCDRLWGVSR